MRLAWSWVLLGAIVAGQAVAQTYTRFVDPVEQAFAADVPKGWQVGGGLVRYGPISLAVLLQALSPDRSILIQLGDPRLRDFSAPTPGQRPGQTYTAGTSILIVRAPEDGQQYARSFAQEFAAQLHCLEPRFSNSEPAANPTGVGSPVGRTSTGLVNFRCGKKEAPYVGRVLASTRITPMPLGAGWSVVYLASFVAREDQLHEAEQVWNRMRTTSAFLPDWNQRESEIARGAIKPAMRQWDQSLDLSRKFDQQVINGRINVDDPAVQGRHEVKLGPHPYYYSNAAGKTVNCPDPTPPPGYHRVEPER